MADDGLGLSAFSQGFQESNRDVLDRTGLGLTPARPASSPQSRVAAATDPENFSLGQTLRDSFLAFDRGQSIPEMRRQRAMGAELDEIGLQQQQAALRRENLSNAVQSLVFAGDLAKQIHSVRDPAKRRELIPQVRSQIAGQVPELAPLVDVMLQNGLLALQDRENLVAPLLRFMPENLRAKVEANNLDFSVLTESEQAEVGAAFQRGVARQILPDAKRFVQSALREAAKLDPKLKERVAGDTLFSVNELEGVLASRPELNPEEVAQAMEVVSVFPEEFGVTPDSVAAEREQFVFERATEARFRQPQQPKNAVNIVTPEPIDGLTTFLSHDGGRTIETPQGRIPAPPGSFIGQVQGTPSEFAPTPPTVRAFREAEIATRNFVDLSNRAIALFRGREDVLGAAGKLADVGNELAATGTGLLAQLGVATTVGGQEASPEELLAASRARANELLDESFFRRIRASGRTQARVESMVVGLAYAAAAAAGQTGRSVSDRDVERFLRRVGASADPVAFEAVLRDIQEEFVQNLANFQTVVERAAGVPLAPGVVDELRQQIGAVPEAVEGSASELVIEEITPGRTAQPTPRPTPRSGL